MFLTDDYRMDESYKKKAVPGPGSYAPYPEFGSTSKKLSFGGRTKSLYGIVSFSYL